MEIEMTKDEWMRGGRHLLRVGWPSRAGEEPDHDAYAFLLRRFTAEQVEQAIESMVGVQKFTPKAATIARACMAMLTTVTGERPETDPAIAAKRAHIERVWELEDARRNRELDEWADAHPEAVAEFERRHPSPYAIGVGVLKRVPQPARPPGRKQRVRV